MNDGQINLEDETGRHILIWKVQECTIELKQKFY